ncbi:MAG: SDR family NAD(P)-dependent oxidoreductase [Saprospiraceae bacterium]|nr:SDR family NAD(P)-dependent oxidoreductase [Saprospiraceae bacterium]HMW39239.1 SDR family NAD(P)-dependent oxidoreductase [Saprospiraceae bacterium]HMX88945.1 SDR family NAD(P)-dependent oxidoreductase [Saprospiraceae bacterium]HMZ40152.1 SDR family NAD(P)-dependent oxidoreductase [Saprospiraceae bacterium]HNA64443.1 SDR family NAD(P)-dependent oxidoreductase [Saprospiraceae bacterium]
MKISGNKILITGGASGIGLGLAEQFVRENNMVIICGRRPEALEAAKLNIPGIITKVCDLSKEEERISLFQWVATEYPDLNVLINNAGIQQWMKVTDENFYTRAMEEISTNLIAPMHLCHLFLNLPSLNTLVNVSSGLAFVPMAKVPVYSATKSFIHSLTLSLRHLLSENNIEVIEIIPPALNTDLGGKGLHDAFPPVSEFVEAVFKQLRAGKNEITFGMSDSLTQMGPDGLKAAFTRMNG